MIAKVVRGYRPGGLLAYLFGPGKHEEHQNPRVVASWDGAPWAHQPDPAPRPGSVVAGEFDLDLRPLVAAMEAEPRRAGLPVRTPPVLPPDWRRALVDGRPLPASAPVWARMWRYDAKLGEVVLRPGYVWHCPVRLAPGDRTLSDADWERIAGRLMRAVGIQQAGCRWVAVRHADDHIHLMATLVSETTGKRFHPFRDYLQLREECRAVEREFGLAATAPADRTARPAPTRAEREKAARARRDETVRDELHRLVSHTVATTATGETFLAALRDRGLDPIARRDANGHIVGYTVARPGDIRADGEKIRYAGRALAPDLTWPKLTARWASVDAAHSSGVASRSALGPTVGAEEGTSAKERRAELSAARRTALVDAMDAARAAATSVHAATENARDTATSEVESVAHAAGELLTVVAAASLGEAPIGEAARRYDRASRTPHTVLASPHNALARDLRRAARQLAAAGAVGSRNRGMESLALTALVLALGSLVAEIAAWQHTLNRPHQAAAARQAGARLDNWAATRNPFGQAEPPAPAPEPVPEPPRPRTSSMAAQPPTPHRTWRPNPATQPGRGRTR